jgi:apolipoprotein N-acyltransferase
VTEPAPPSRIETALLRHPLLTAALAGIAAALALPPWHIVPGLLGFALLALLIARAPSAARAFGRGLAFTFPHYLLSLYWVAIAFSAEAEQVGALALPATFLMCLVCALIPAIGMFLLRLAGVSHTLPTALGIATIWGLTEWIRGAVIGFPWNPMALVWAASEPTLQVLSLTGTPALSVLTVGAAGAAVVTLTPAALAQRLAGLAPALVLTLVIVGFGWWKLSIPLPPPTDLELRIVQADIAQDHKWDPERLRENFLRHVELSEEPAPTLPKIVIWPESAVPFSLESDEVARGYVSRIAMRGDGYVVVGSNHFARGTDDSLLANNSVYILDGKGEFGPRYDKVNLVPFGEFLPFRWALGALGLEAVAARGDFQRGPGRVTVALDGIPPFSPLVCYEVAFPSEATDGTGRARWLLNITNDAWFGDSAGPWQHLALARARSVEEGLPIVRAANTGISTVTDSYGRVLAELGLGERGVIDGQLPAALPERPMGGRYGTMLGWLAIVLLGSACLWREYRANSPPSE